MTYYDSITGRRYTWDGRPAEVQIPSPIVIVQPDIEPVTLAEMKNHLRVDEDITDLDEEIDNLIVAGRQFVEQYTGLALIDQTLEMTLDDYPASGVIRLRAPLIDGSVTFEYSEEEGTYTTLDDANYKVDTHQRAPRIIAAFSIIWPDTVATSGSVRIRWRAGFADRTGSPTEGAERVPYPLKSAIKLHAEAYHDRDERMMETLLAAAVNLCRPYCVSHGIA